MPSERRLHPLSILFSLGSLLRSFALPGIAVLATAGSTGWGWQLWLLWLVPLYAIAGVGRYLTFRYRYEAHEMVVRSGFLFRNERHIPYSRIQNLDGVQNVFHRLFGVVTVRVETGGGQKPEATMSVLPAADLEEMRRRVFAGKAAGRAEAAAVEAGEAVEGSAAAPAPGRTLLHLSPRELMLFGLIENRGAVVIAAALGLFVELQVSDRFFGESFKYYKGPLRDTIRQVLASGGDWLVSSRIAVAVVSVLALLVLLRLVSMAWALVRLYGFRLTLAGEDLRTEFGLLTRVAATIPLRRIQTLSIREGPLFRLFGRASVKADTAGADGGGDGEEKPKHREWLAPILRRTELPRLVREVLPGLDLAAVDWQPVHPRAFRRQLKKSLLVAVVASLPSVVWLRGWALVPLAILVAWAVVVARRSVAHLGWAVTGDAVLFRSGWLWRRVIVARFVKIQAVAIHESPFDRRAAMARVRVDTAGAKDLTHRVDIPYLARETARELHGLLAAQAARTAFRW